MFQVGGSLNHITCTEAFDPFDDCNVYVIKAGEKLILVDCGNGETLEQIIANIRYWGLSPENVTHCLLTHSHWDHAGAGSRLAEMGVELIAHEKTAEAVAAGDERCCGFLYHKEFTPCRIDTTVVDGQLLSINGLEVACHHYPGHTAGCTAYRIEQEGKVLVFSGDVIGTLGYGFFGWDGSVDFDKKRYIESLTRFARLDFDVMLPGHGLVTFRHAKRRVETSLNEALIQWR